MSGSLRKGIYYEIFGDLTEFGEGADIQVGANQIFRNYITELS